MPEDMELVSEAIPENHDTPQDGADLTVTLTATGLLIAGAAFTVDVFHDFIPDTDKWTSGYTGIVSLVGGVALFAIDWKRRRH